MSNVLVIHPYDETTECLKGIYEGYDFDVIRDYNNYPKERLMAEIEKHEKIIAIGHGNHSGLINPEYKTDFDVERKYLIDHSFADLLRTKDFVSLWCYSDAFCKINNLKGFHTGMIISEYAEEEIFLDWEEIRDDEDFLSEEEMNENMCLLSKVMNECIFEEPLKMKEHILEGYVGDDPVTRYNRKRIIVLE